MGCICSKGASEIDVDDEYEEEKELNKASVQLVAPVPSKRENNLVVEIGGGGGKNIDGSVGSESRKPNDEDSRMLLNEIPPSSYHQRWPTLDLETSGRREEMSRIASIPNGVEGEQNVAGWPSWLTSVAADAIKGWLPRQADSFEKLDKVSFRICGFFYLFYLVYSCFTLCVCSDADLFLHNLFDMPCC